MAWVILVIGIVLLGGGILGQTFGIEGPRRLRPDERKAALFALRIASLLIGVWLLIYGASAVIRHHHRQRMHIESQSMVLLP